MLTVSRPPPEFPAKRRVHVVQGEFYFTGDPNVVLTTLLGSCVSACLHDPVSRIGGMNHFLLPGDAVDGRRGSTAAMRYGVHAMELLINGLLQHGAHRNRLEAKLFGGSRMLDGLTDIGSQNAGFAEQFLCQERIAFTGGSLRGERGRWVQFQPSNGRARQKLIEREKATVFEVERPAGAVSCDAGIVELF